MWLWAALVVALLAPVVIFGGGVAGRGCTACHRADSASPHATLGCGRCHSSGVVGGVSSGVHNLGAVVAALPVLEPPVPFGAVGNSACLRCHADVENDTVSARGLRMNHGTCLAGRQSCADCHGRALHAGAKGPARTVQMDACLSCHGTISRKEGCDLCHAGKRDSDLATTSWSVTHGPNWQATHGAGDLRTCTYCHRDDLCSECHLQMPHPEKWAGSHGGVAAADVKACLTCHQRGFCDSCHGMQMPHPAKWLKQHPDETDGYTDFRCARCHLTEDCQACHEKHTHPGLVNGEPAAKAAGGK